MNVVISKLFLLLGLAVFGGLAPFNDATATNTADRPKAVGVVLVADGETLPDTEKIYADAGEDGARFNLDAACAYCVEKDAESSWAGQQNFCRLRFGVDLDTNQYSAEGVVSLRPAQGAANAVSAYYLYADDRGLYFMPGAPFASLDAVPGALVEGRDFVCSVALEEAQPAHRFAVAYCDAEGRVLSRAQYGAQDVEDYETMPSAAGAAYAEVTVFDADGAATGTLRVTPEDRDPYLCIDLGGRILGSRILDMNWQ